MSDFVNKIKTILQIDDKDWKKSLESVSQAEKEHASTFKKLQKEQAEALQQKNKFLVDQSNKVASLEKEILEKIKERTLARQNEANLDEKTKRRNIALINQEIAALKDKKTIEKATTKKDTIDYSNTEKAFKSLVDFEQNYADVLKKAKEGLANYANERKQFEKDFVNTSAQNKYNDTLAKLNSLESRGIITSQEKQKALAKEKLAIDESEKSTSNLLNTGIRYLRWTGTLMGAYYGLIAIWDKTIGKGFELNKIVENNTYGIAALVSANTQMTDSLGKTLSPIEKFTIGQEHAKEVIKTLRLESVKTAATFPQLLEIFQQGIGKTLSLGDSFGATTKIIEANTIKLSARMSNFASAIGMPMDRVKEEMRSLISGNASTDSLIATIIFGSPGQANSAIKEAEKKVNGVAELLDIKFKPFDILADTKTFDKSVLSLQNSWSNAMGDIVEKSGAFKDVTNIFYDMSRDIANNTDNIVKKFDSMYGAIKTMFTALTSDAAQYGLAIAGILGTVRLIASMTPQGRVIAGVVGTGMAYETYQQSEVNKETDKKIAEVKKLVAESKTSIEDNLVKKRLQEQLEDMKKALEAKQHTSTSVADSLDTLTFDNTVPERELESQRKIKSTIEEQIALVEKRLTLSDDERKIMEKFKVDSVAVGELLANRKDRTEEIKKDEEALLSLLGNTAKYQKEITDKQKEKAELEKELIGIQEQQKKADAGKSEEDKNSILAVEAEKIKNAINNKDKLIAENQRKINEEKDKALEKQIADTDKIANKNKQIQKDLQEQNQKYAEQEAIRAEIALIESGMFDDEKLKVEMSLLKINSLVKEYSLLEDMADKEKVKLELLREGLKYEQLISMEQQLRGDKSETAQDLIILNDQLLGIEKNITSEKQKIFFSQMALTEMKVKELLISKQITQAEADAFNTKLQAIAETRIAQDEYQKNLTAGIKNFDDAIKNIQNQTVTIDVKFNGFNEATNGFASIANGIIDISNANSQVQEQEAILAETRKNYPKDVAKIGAEEKKLTKIKSAQFNTTIDGYGSMIGALGNFYDEDDHRRERQQKLAEAFHYIKMAQQVSEMMQSTAFTSLFVAQESAKATAAGTTAVATAAQSSPWTGIATATAMIALLASVGLALGGSSAKKSFSSDSLSSMKANTGTGTVLGDTEAQSESIVNALSILENFAEPQYQTLLSMNRYLSAIASGIGGVSSLLIQEGGYAFGQGFKSTDTGWKNNVGGTTSNALSWGALGASGGMGLASMGVAGIGGAALSLADSLTGGKLNSLINKIPIVGDLNKLAGSVTSKILGGIFGKTSVSSKMKDSGMFFADQLLTEATKNFIGSAYQTVETTTTKKSWFSKSTSSSSKTSTQGLSDQINRQFTMVIDNLYKTTLLAGEALDTTTTEVEDRLKNFVVSLGKVSLYKKSGDEIQKTLEAIFGRLGDQIATSAFPLLTAFQGIGEGMFETMTRVATGMEEAEYYIERLGYQFKDLPYWEVINKQGNIGFEALLQSIIKTDEATNGLNNNLVQIVGSLNSTAEELYGAYTALDTLRDTLRFLKMGVETLSFDSIRGAGSIDALVDGISAYTENFLSEQEQLSLKTTLLQKEFNKLNIAMPVGKDGFASLINGIDKTTASGQELYGRLIILSESFANVADSVKESIESLESTLKDKSQTIFDKFITSMSKVFDSIVGMAENTQNTILGIKTKDTGNEQETIYNQFVEYNKLLAKFESAQQSGDIKTAESAYSSILGLSSTLSEAGYETQIVGLLENKLAGFNTQKDTLRVNVVDGLGELLDLTETQTNQLKYAARDGAITNAELSGIAGLTESQTTSIKEFANNSNYFSTEDTLSNLEEYAKAQLEVLRTAQAEEKEALSAKSFTVGDYTGSQEKIDISKALGITYDTAKPLIEQLQGLSVSTDLKKDISNIIGYKGYEYDISKVSQIEKLGQYLNPDIMNALTGVKTESTANIEQRNIFEAAKSDFYKRLTTAQSTLDSLNSAIASAADSYAYWDAKVAKTDNGSSNYKTYKANRAAAAQQLWGDLPPQINSYTALLNGLYEEKKLKGYAIGGYTGDIPTNAIAGFVHGREYVLDANVTSQINSIGSVTDMVSRYTSTNGFSQELVNIKNVLVEQNKYFNGIISQLQNQIRILTESKDIQNESLVTLQAIEEVA